MSEQRKLIIYPLAQQDPWLARPLQTRLFDERQRD
jgi:hypothetical protein